MFKQSSLNPKEHLVKLVQVMTILLILFFGRHLVPLFWFIDNIYTPDSDQTDLIDSNSTSDINLYCVNVTINITILMFGLCAVIKRSDLMLIVFVIILNSVTIYGKSKLVHLYISITISLLCSMLIAFHHEPNLSRIYAEKKLHHHQQKTKQTLKIYVI